MSVNAGRIFKYLLCGTALVWLTACGGGGGGSSASGGSGGSGGVALVDGSGHPLGATPIASGHALAATISGLAPKDLALVLVTAPGTATVPGPFGLPSCSFYETLKSDKAGSIPLTSLTPRLTAGTYHVAIYDLTKSGSSSTPIPVLKSNTQFTVADNAVSSPSLLAGSVASNVFTPAATFAPGATIYVHGAGLPKSKAMTLYVVAHQSSWIKGDKLIDVSGFKTNPPFNFTGGQKSLRKQLLIGTAKQVSTDAQGNLATLAVWTNINAEAVGQTFDLVLDANQTGLYDPATDILGDVDDASISVATTTKAVTAKTAILAYNSNYSAQNIFDVPESVYTKFGSSTHSSNAQVGQARVYVVEHKNSWADGDTLTDVSGLLGASQFTTVPTFDGVPYVAKQAMYTPDLIPGAFDMIINVAGDGKYSLANDIIDGGGNGGSFSVNNTVAPKAWTVMVYLDGDNNLESDAINNFMQMEKVNYGANSPVTVVVQFARSQGNDTSNGNWTGCRRYVVAHTTNPAQITTKPLEDLGQVNMADPASLTSFMNWAKHIAPATNYALIVWDHGTGFSTEAVVKGRSTTTARPLDIAEDDGFSGVSMTIPQVVKAIQAGGGANLVGFDACLMGSAEIAYELRNSCQVYVSSEALLPGTGYEYSGFLNALVATPSMTSQDLGRAIVQSTSTYYTSHPDSYTMSAVDTASTFGIANSMGALADAIQADPNGTGPLIDRSGVRNNLIGAYSTVQRFDKTYDYYCDLQDLCANIKALDIDPTIVTAAGDAGTALQKSLIAEAHSSDFPSAHGLTVFYPRGTEFANNAAAYATIGFGSDSNWTGFLSNICTTKVLGDKLGIYVAGAKTSFSAEPEENTGRVYTWSVDTKNGLVDDGNDPPSVGVVTGQSTVKISAASNASGAFTISAMMSQASGGIGTYQLLPGSITLKQIITNPIQATADDYPDPANSDDGKYIAHVSLPKAPLSYVRAVLYYDKAPVGAVLYADVAGQGGIAPDSGNLLVPKNKLSLNAGAPIPPFSVYDDGNRVEAVFYVGSYTDSTSQSQAAADTKAFATHYSIDLTWVTSTGFTPTGN